jgi:DNA-binding transcriptional MerR regulator
MIGKTYDKEFLSIKEFSAFVGLSVSTLRFYNRIRILMPFMRDKGTKNNRYRYSALQITVAKMIRVLTEIGVPLKTIKELVDNRTPEMLLKELKSSKIKIVEKINHLYDVDSVIDTYTTSLVESISIKESKISVIQMDGMQLLLGKLNDYAGTIGFVREYTRFCSDINEPGLSVPYPIGGYWESMTAFLDEPSRPQRFFSLDQNGREWKAEGLYLVGYTRGYYGETNDLPARMEAYADRNRIEFIGPVYNIYLQDELSITNPEQYLLQVSAAVRDTRRATWRYPSRKY